MESTSAFFDIAKFTYFQWKNADVTELKGYLA